MPYSSNKKILYKLSLLISVMSIIFQHENFDGMPWKYLQVPNGRGGDEKND